MGGEGIKKDCLNRLYAIMVLIVGRKLKIGGRDVAAVAYIVLFYAA